MTDRGWVKVHVWMLLVSALGCGCAPANEADETSAADREQSADSDSSDDTIDPHVQGSPSLQQRGDAGGRGLGAPLGDGGSASVAPHDLPSELPGDQAPLPSTVDPGGASAPATRDAGARDASAPRDAASTRDAAANPSLPDASSSTRDAGSATRDAGSATRDAGNATVDASTPSAAGACAVPSDAQLEDSSRPTTVVGTGTAASCTSSAFVAAVAKGGVITFNCGDAPATIVLDQTAKVFNDRSQKVVIDGGGKITLSGGGRVRILYQNTCDQAQVWTTAHCDNQEFPQLTVQNLTFIDGSAKSTDEGGGAIYAQGGRLKILNSRFYGNACADVGPDVGGGAVRALMQYQGLPAYVVNSTFGAPGRGNVCSNGGALSSIGVSYTVLNSTFRDNRAIGRGANPAQAGTPGGGSGGAIYNDGNTYQLNLCGSTLTDNGANEGGGAIFFVSNDRSGTMSIRDSLLERNPSGKFETQPGLFVLAKGEPTIVNSVVR